MTADLAGFLLARITDDEEAALPFRDPAGGVSAWRADEIGGKVRQVGPMPFGLPDVVSESDTHLTAAHIARHDPARVLADCAAKRAIVEMHVGAHECPTPDSNCGWCVDSDECDTLRALAQPYAGHPDCRPEWRTG